MATAKSSTLSYFIHNLFRRPKPTPTVCLLPRPFSISVITRNRDEARFPSIYSQYFSSVRESEQDEYNVSESGRSSEVSQEMMAENSSLKLSVKEKKKLASYAHSLGDKLICQHVGKSGVTDSVVLSFLETVEKNELLKVKIHRTCPGELEDIALHLEEATGSVSVGQIGRTVILYRPSPTKLKTENK